MEDALVIQTRRSSPLAALALAGGAMLAAAFALPLTAVCATAATDGPTPATADHSGSLVSDVILYPAAPCIQDTITVFVRGYVATPCDSFVGAEKVGDHAVVIRQQVYTDRACLVAPFQFYSVPIPMGRFSAGSQSIEIRRETIAVSQSGQRDTVRTTTALAFEVSTVCLPPPTLPADQLPFVTRVGTVPSPPCPDHPTTVHLDGVFPDGCGRVVSVDPATLSLVIAPYPPPGTACTLALQPWSYDFPLGLMAQGHYRVAIRMTVLGSNAAWPPIPTQSYVGVFDFDVQATCGPQLPPYLLYVRVTPKRPCGSDGPICPGDSIQVVLGGSFPNSCFHVVGLELIQPPYASPIPMPPILRLTVSDEGCSRIACALGPVGWTRAIAFGPLLTGNYGLVIEEVRRLGCPPTEDVTTAIVPFEVSAPGSCPIPDCARCLLPEWLGPSGPGACAAYITPGGSTSVVLGVGTPVALAGLEGTLSSDLPVTQLEAIGSAAGMNLQWSPTSDGVRFVMFAPQGAPIPVSASPAPVLRVTVAAPTGDGGLRHYLRTGFDVLGSDIGGGAVPMCLLPGKTADPQIGPPTAEICVKQGSCDFNADGVLDVRDLVLMVHCVNDLDACPPDAGSLFDCDGDADFDLADVICCAFELLRGPECPACVADSVRPAPGVAVGFGSPRAIPGGLEVPVRIDGASVVGGALLRLRFPDERFVVTGIEGDPSWLALHQESGGDLSIGLVRASPAIPAVIVGPLELVVRLSLRSGAEVGGEVQVVEGDFSGLDGVQLAVTMGAPELILDRVSVLSLSAARPNPFSGETRFTLTLERSGPVDVAIYDLAGRRVATVLRGTVPAGPTVLRWDGRDDGGRRVPGGVYFSRASAGGLAVTRRMVMLQGP